VYVDDYKPELASAEALHAGARSARPHRLFFGEWTPTTLFNQSCPTFRPAPWRSWDEGEALLNAAFARLGLRGRWHPRPAVNRILARRPVFPVALPVPFIY